MTRYALVREADSTILKFSSDITGANDGDVQGVKAGLKWVPVTLAVRPDPGPLQVAELTHVVDNGAVVQQWSLTRKPLAAQQAAVKAEAQRRIIALTGAQTLEHCFIKQFNANMRATELNDIRLNGGTWTAAEAAEAQALRDLAAAIKAIRAASNSIEAMSPIPLDYTADSHWPE